MNRVQLLMNLQAVDYEWDDKGRRYQTVRTLLADASEHSKLSTHHEKIQQNLSTTRAKLRDSELELATLQIKYKEVTKSLYSGHVLNPRDLDNLQKESISLKSRLEHLENDTLALMSETEDLEEQRKESEAALYAFENTWAVEQVNLAQESNALRSRLHELQEQRDRLRGALGRADLTLYDELRAKKGGNAMAQMVANSCQTCHVSVPSRKAYLVEAGEDIVLCEGCGRILYVA